MMKFRNLDDARSFFNELHTDHDSIKATSYYHQQVMDIEVHVTFLPKYLKAFCHDSGCFFIIGEGVFIDEGANSGDFPPLPDTLVEKLQRSVAKGFMPYSVMAAIQEYRLGKIEDDIYEAFPDIMMQFDRMLELLA